MRKTILIAGCLSLSVCLAGGCAGADNGSPANGAAMTPEQCEERGGRIMGDPGDGRIHRPDYRCPNGQKPIAPVRYETGDMIPVEGSVCCPK